MDNHYLRRYTDIPSLLHILDKKQITLLDPDTWDDRNDSHSLSVFKQRNELTNLHAICFTESAETYHHWHVFAGGPSGVCIVFNKNCLLRYFPKAAGFVSGPVDYRTLKMIRETPPKLEELPFVKRAGYIDECEFRIIYANQNRRKTRDKKVTISTDCIDRIILSPWVHSSLIQSIRKIIISTEGSERPDNFVSKSSLRINTEWKEWVNTAS